MGSDSDAEVVLTSLEKPATFGVVYERHASKLLRYLLRRVGPGEAEALLGEVFRIAFEKRSSYDGTRSNALPWLYGIATNAVAHHRRGEARRLAAMARLVAGQAVETADETTIDALEAKEKWPTVASALAALTPSDRDTLLLVAWEELSYEEVAAALSIPVGTVRSRLNRARRKLRELAGGSGREQPGSELSDRAGP